MAERLLELMEEEDDDVAIGTVDEDAAAELAATCRLGAILPGLLRTNLRRCEKEVSQLRTILE